MSSALQADLQRLHELAYGRLEWSGALVRAFHRLRRRGRSHPAWPLLETAHAWLLAPFTLWPIDIHGLCVLLQERIKAGSAVEAELRVLIASLPPLPSATVQATVARHERTVQGGSYENLIHAPEKYVLSEEQLLGDPAFGSDWQQIKETFRVARYRDALGIIRRSMVAERGFRTDGQLRWSAPRQRFSAVFNAFCAKWSLYGMQGDRPLLQKLSVNLTPHGTMIFIPSWWSLDAKRDFAWREIAHLHRVRAPHKQGAKLSRNRLELAAEARHAVSLNTEAKAQGLRGARREEWVMARLGWKNGEPRKLRLVLSRGRSL